MAYLMGIDGGGTKTHGVLTDIRGRILSQCFVGATNPNDVTLPVAVDRLTELTACLLREAGLSEESLPEISMFFGIAGGINYGPALESSLCERFPEAEALTVRSDIHILLSGEIPEGDGACIICGTGSACFLRRGDEVIRIGGWGYLLDSGGSGYDIGRDALEAALRHFDGRGEATILSALLAEHLGGAVNTRITDIYREGKPYIAACAPLVFHAARQGDPVAEAILNRNARKLAEYAECAWRWLTADGRAVPQTLPVVMGGGISSHEAPAWQTRIRGLTDPAVPAVFTPALMPPVFGAVTEAMRRSREGTAASYQILKEGFLDSYRR
jgi:N-acetylglucosamine kinase-like BadF-type ATPase